MSETIWFCVRCGKKQPGNPRWCSRCGHTVYRPEFETKKRVDDVASVAGEEKHG